MLSIWSSPKFVKFGTEINIIPVLLPGNTSSIHILFSKVLRDYKSNVVYTLRFVMSNGRKHSGKKEEGKKNFSPLQ